MFQSKDTLVLAIMTVITVMAWIAFDVYHAVSTSQITDVENSLITPLNPNIDPQILSDVQSRQTPQ